MDTGNDSILEAFLYETNGLLEQLDSSYLPLSKRTHFPTRISIPSSALCTPSKVPRP